MPDRLALEADPVEARADSRTGQDPVLVDAERKAGGAAGCGIVAPCAENVFVVIGNGERSVFGQVVRKPELTVRCE